MEGAFEEIEAGIVVRHWSNLNGIYNHYARPAYRPDIVVNVYVGQTGSGKTYRAFKEAEAFGDYYVKNALGKWWDGYKGEENVIIDEFGDKCLDIKHLLLWLQEYPTSVEVKGSRRVLKAKRFWITSNLGIDEWFPEAHNDHLQALKRRITNIEQMNSRYVQSEVDEELNNIFNFEYFDILLSSQLHWF